MKHFLLALSIFTGCLAHAESLTLDSLKKFAVANWRSEPEKCLQYTYDASQLAIEQNDTLNYAWSLNFRGIIYGFTGNFDSSFHYYNKSLDYCKKNNIEEYIFKSTMNLAINHQMLGNYEKSLDFFFQVLKIFEEKGDSLGIAHCFGGMGNNYVKLRQLEKGEEIYLKSIGIYEKLGMPMLAAPIYSNLGVIYRDQGRNKEALDIFLKVIPILEEANQNVSLASTYVNVAGLYHTDDFNKSDEYYDKSIAICLKINKNDVLVQGYTGKGELRNIHHKYEEAIFMLKKALSIPVDKPDLDLQLDIYHRLTRAFEQTGREDSALVYFKKEVALKDSISGLEIKKSIAQLEIGYETAKKEKQLAEQQIEIATQEAQVQRRNLQLVGLGGGIITLFLLGAIVYTRQKAHQQQLQQQLELEKVESLAKVQNEKLRISRDLHDNIGSQLTFVISSLDNMNYIKEEEKRREKLAQLGSFTKTTMNELRETIWAIKSESVSLEQLISKVAEFLDKAKIACPNIEFKIRENYTENKTLNSNQAINLYRTIQEAVNNAIKHASASSISLEVSENEIQIIDDGQGFDKANITEGNGTINMHARMKEVGFTTKISSIVGSGTTVRVLLEQNTL